MLDILSQFKEMSSNTFPQLTPLTKNEKKMDVILIKGLFNGGSYTWSAMSDKSSPLVASF